MVKGDRSAQIRRYLYTSGPSSVQAIAGAVGTSLATVRRDLHLLENAGFILRDHGGARIAERAGGEVAFEQRELKNLAAKRAIADAAYDMLEPDSTVFLDAGTTVYQLARRLRLNPIPLNIVSNCILIAQELALVRGVSVTLLGGRLRPGNASMVGILTERALDELWFDQVFIGAGAIAPDGGIYSVDADEARANAKMLTRASRRTVLVDATKFGQVLTYRVAPLSAGLGIITDELPADWARRLAGIGCAVQISPVPRVVPERQAS